MIGNSLDLKNPFHGHMRHLIFTKEGFDSNVLPKFRAIVLPTDENVLAYF